MPEQSLRQLTTHLRKFAAKRDWDQFHSPKNLSMALSVETSELMGHFLCNGGKETLHSYVLGKYRKLSGRSPRFY